MPKIRINDIDIHYQITGEGPPILFIHGLGSSAVDWDLQVSHFSKRYQVITFDVRGHGQSDKPPGPYSVPLFASDTAGLIRSLKIAPTHIVGISMGGMIVFQLAVNAPDLIRSIVIVNSGPKLVLQTLKARLSALQRFLIVYLLGMKRFGQVLSKRLFPKPEQTEIRRLLVERWAKNDPRAYRSTMRGLIGWDVADQLGNIRCPTLVIAAYEDYTPVAFKEEFVTRIPGSELVVIQDSRHATPVDQPEIFNQVVMEFLMKQD